MLQLTRAFLRLIRWPNLVFIFLTQFLFYYCVLLPGFHPKWAIMKNIPAPDLPGGYRVHLQPGLFYLLSLSSILIAAAGYIINDYFDLNIDRVNKPDKLVVEKIIKRRWTIIWHWILSGLGVLPGFYVSWKVGNPVVGLANLGCVILLWFYSTIFKRKLLIGNIIISLLTAWVILVLYICEFSFADFRDPVYHALLSRLFKFAILYGGFAFIISLIREVVKDIEDLEGDMRYGCRTMPIVWGVNVAKVFAGKDRCTDRHPVLCVAVWLVAGGALLLPVAPAAIVLDPPQIIRGAAPAGLSYIEQRYQGSDAGGDPFDDHH